MTQRAMLILAATLSVFALVLVGGLAAQFTTQPPPATPTAAIADAATQAGLDPTAVQALVDQREQSYQQLINQANERLHQANVQLDQAYQKQQSLATQLEESYKRQQAAQRPVAAQPRAAVPHPQPQPQPQPTAAPAPAAPAAPVAPAAPTYAVTPDLAAAIAMNVAPGAQLARQPELVNFQGTVAYEVMLDRGAMYVDANSGQVIYNAVAPPAPAGGGHGEHEGGEHDD